MSFTLAKLDVGINTEDSTRPTGRAGLSVDALPGQNLSLILDDALDVGLYCHDCCLNSVLVVVFVLTRFFCAAIWMFIAVFIVASPQNLL